MAGKPMSINGKTTAGMPINDVPMTGISINDVACGNKFYQYHCNLSAAKFVFLWSTCPHSSINYRDEEDVFVVDGKIFRVRLSIQFVELCVFSITEI